MSTMRRIAPVFPVRDLEVALDHYRRLGFSVRRYAGGDYGYATRGGIEIHLGVTTEGRGARASAYLFVDDADELAQVWRDDEIEVHTPVDTAWGQREGAVDPDGDVIRFGSPRRVEEQTFSTEPAG